MCRRIFPFRSTSPANEERTQLPTTRQSDRSKLCLAAFVRADLPSATVPTTRDTYRTASRIWFSMSGVTCAERAGSLFVPRFPSRSMSSISNCISAISRT